MNHEPVHMPHELLVLKCKKTAVPESIPGRVIFMYDYEQEFYIITD